MIHVLFSFVLTLFKCFQRGFEFIKKKCQLKINNFICKEKSGTVTKSKISYEN